MGVLSAAERNFLTSCSGCFNPNGVSESGPVHQGALTLRERRLGNGWLVTRWPRARKFSAGEEVMIRVSCNFNPVRFWAESWNAATHRRAVDPSFIHW
jgi:hypothetical protein